MKVSLSVLLLVLTIEINLYGQDRTINGKVTSFHDGQTLPGVNIQLKGSQIGTITNADGIFILQIPANESSTTLIFSFVGFTTQEIGIEGIIKLDVVMREDVIQLSEVVVTGYNSIAKENLSSSITAVDVNEMKKLAASNFAEQLQGKVAGVQISTSGDPASLQYVRVRGIGTINNNEPLYVIDGVPIQNETDFNFINPNDIETLQVLKDAAAASLYGARAANGVIVITTRRGAGRPKLNVDFFTGIQQPRDFPEMASPQEMLDIWKGLYAGAGQEFTSEFYVKDSNTDWVLPDFLVGTKGYSAEDPAVDPSKYVMNTLDPKLYGQNYPIVEANKNGTNWFKELFKPATMTNFQLSSESGTEKGSHYMSLNYYEQNGNLIYNNWKRIQSRMNSTFSPFNNVRIGENLNMSMQTGKGFYAPFRGAPRESAVERAYDYLTIAPSFDIKGYWAANSLTSTLEMNPVAAQYRSADGLETHTLRLTGNAFAEIDFLQHFTFKINTGLDYFSTPIETYTYACPECKNNELNNLKKELTNSSSWVINGTINYNRELKNHSISALGGIETRQLYQENFSAQGKGLVYGDDPSYRELSNAQSNTSSNTSSSTMNRMVSAFVNMNYAFQEKYLLSATFRADGSSKFVNNKYGFFPAISAAWRISKESFLTTSQFVQELKLRASYGMTGNNEVVGGDYPGYSSYGTDLGLSSYSINGQPNQVTQGFAPVSAGNPDLKWETCYITNLGFDLKIWHFLDLTLEWYTRNTADMIYAIRQPLETGNLSPLNSNVGTMINKGVELQIGYKGKALHNKVNYSISLTGTHYQNKVQNLYDSITFITGASLHPGYPALTRTSPGYPISQFYGYLSEGLWKTQSEIDEVLYEDAGGALPGRMRFKDINSDGQITEADQTFIGNPLPKFTLGLNISLSYKKVDLTAYFSGVFGNKIFNAVKSYTEFYQTEVLFNDGKSKSNKMMQEAGISLPILDLNDTYSGKVSSYLVEDGTFTRCRNVVLGYSFHNGPISKFRISQVRIYFQVQNLFTLTKYSGLDPDVTIQNMSQGNLPLRDLTVGIDTGRYPWSRQYILGANILF